MIVLNDLKRFNTLLENKNTETIKKLCILKKLESWEPVKDFIVISNIGKTIFRLSKAEGDVGLKSSIIVKKWTKYLLLSPEKKKEKPDNIDKVSKNFNQSSISNTSNLIKEIKQTPKKNSLSLKDYYQRKRIGISQDQVNNNSESSTTRDELTSDLGISFMDSFSIRPINQIKPKKTKILKISEIRAITDHDNILNRNDIINQSNTIKNLEDENLTARAEVNLKFWQPKAPRYCYTEKQPQTLLKLCQDILVTYRTHIEEVYLTPRELLLTVLENYTPDQLITFESYNPHFIVDNDELWRKHLQLKFPNFYENIQKSKQEESWRNYYFEAIWVKTEKFQSSVENMKRKIQDNKKKEENHQVKVINSSYRNPEKRKFFIKRYETESCMYSSVTKKLMKQCRKDCAYFKF